ncbi:MAG: branched-chain amino acid transaminase [candidate division Zixibacteria bacterium]|nr:branched-chain amino acid transaminase [Candidatus Tariuqbacter arcticus]
MAKFDETLKIWFSGKFIDWKDATIHICSHVVHYGSSVFEGLRCYNTAHGAAAFRLNDHVKRLFNSAKIYRIKIPFSEKEVFDACLETLSVNKQQEAYIRPIVFRGYDSLGVDPRSCPVETVIITWAWGAYLGEEAINVGVDVRVSSWNRMAPNTFPALAKCGANYMNSQLIKQEALVDGYIEGIALDTAGYVSEGSGENIFAIMNGKIITPPLGASVLPGITRDSVIRIANDLGYEVIEQIIPREMLYIADEVFFTGSAAEVSPIKSIDRIPVGEGCRGPITEKIQRRFFDIIEGKVEDPYGWLTFVYE